MECKSIKLVIHPTVSDQENLTVGDAMQQVLDYFNLLDKAAAGLGGNATNIIWELQSASANSPFTIEAKAVSRDPGQPVEEEAFASISLLADCFNRVLHGDRPPDWMDVDARTLLEGLLKRNSNGIRQTDFYFPGSVEPMIIEANSAKRAVASLNAKSIVGEREDIDMRHTEMGSIEGRITQLRSYNGKPAIWLKTHLEPKEIPCIFVDRDVCQLICATRNWEQVYENRRVLIPGVLFYDRNGRLSKVEISGKILDIDPIPVNYNELYDPDFSDGLSAEEHLNRLRA
jgi:hypothetical protein